MKFFSSLIQVNQNDLQMKIIIFLYSYNRKRNYQCYFAVQKSAPVYYLTQSANNYPKSTIKIWNIKGNEFILIMRIWTNYDFRGTEVH